MAELHFSSAASADLIEIYAFSIERFDRSSALRYHDGLEAACERLVRFPALGALYPGISPPIRYLAFRSHNILYDVENEKITIVRILHQAMNAARHVRQ